MDVELDTSKSAIWNLSQLFEKLKLAKAKKNRVLDEINRTKSELEKIQKDNCESQTKNNLQVSNKKNPKSKKKWWDPYRTFVTSGGFRVVAGKNAKQNDELYAKQISENDLFFHADIQGAPATIMKNAKDADKSDLIQVAQWAGSYSSAWKSGSASVDVYCVEKNQLSKHSSGGYIGRGAFAINGERKWFRETELKLKLGFLGQELCILPSFHPAKLERQLFIKPNGAEREVVAKELSALLSCKMDLLLQILPSGKISYSK